MGWLLSWDGLRWVAGFVGGLICEGLALCGFFGGCGSAFEETDPPCRGVERAVAAVQRRVDVVEEIPDYRVSASIKQRSGGLPTVSDHNAAHFVFGHSAVHDQREAQ